MKIILVPVIVFLLSQSIKFFSRLIKNDKKLDTNALWVYMWASGAPSTHSAVLVSALYMLYLDIGLTPLFIFCSTVAVILMYNLVADKKRQEIVQDYFLNENPNEKMMAQSKKVLDISGHTFFDIFMGIIVGFILAVILNIFL